MSFETRRRAVLRLASGALFVACSLILTGPQASPASPSPDKTGIQVGRSTQISKEDPNGLYFESILAVDPRDPLHMVAVSSAARNGDTYSGFYATFDGGAAWHRARMAHASAADAAFVKGGDGAVFFGASGTVFGIVGTRVNKIPKTLISRSTDGGATWQTPVVLSYRDRPWMGFDTDEYSRTYGRIYAVGQISSFIFSTSNDDGKTFTPGDVFVRDPSGPDTKTPWNPLPTRILVAPDGTVIEPFTAPYPGHPYSPKVKINRGLIRLVASEDGGRTFGPARTGPTTYNNEDVRTGGDASSAIDLSAGPNRGRVYVAYTDYENGKNVIQLARTSDVGKTWASSLVSDIPNGHTPNNPAVAVSKDGVVAVVWNDRRDDPDDECWRLYGAISIDGGAHFLPNARLSDGPTCVNTPGNWQPSTWYEFNDWTDPKHPLPEIGFTAFVPVRFPNGGDTQGLAADSNGVFHAAWINGLNGKLAFWQTDFSVDTALLGTLRQSNGAFRSGVSVPLPAGQIDESQELTFVTSHPVIDFTHHVLSMTVSVVNPTTHAVHGPIDVVLAHMFTPLDLGMSLKNLHPINADNGMTSEGASWTFAAGAGEVLLPNQQTSARVLTFGFDGGPPKRSYGYFTPRFYIRTHAQ